MASTSHTQHNSAKAPVDLYDLTQSKLERSLSVRRKSSDLRRLVLLTNATSSWNADGDDATLVNDEDNDEQLTEEELQR